MALDELFEYAERLKLLFVAGFDRLLQRGLLSEAQFEELLEIVDRLDEFSEEELAQKLEVIIRQVEAVSQPGRDDTAG